MSLTVGLIVGKTRVEGPPERSKDLSLETLTNDLVGIVEHMFPDPKASPSLLVGHWPLCSDLPANGPLDGLCACPWCMSDPAEEGLHYSWGSRSRRGGG